jgi:hypothetical protein
LRIDWRIAEAVLVDSVSEMARIDVVQPVRAYRAR